MLARAIVDYRAEERTCRVETLVGERQILLDQLPRYVYRNKPDLVAVTLTP